MLKFLLTTLAVVGVVAFAGIAWAKHNGYCSDGNRLQHVTERISRKLDLTEAQKAKLQSFAETLHSLRGEGTELRAQLRDALDNLLAAPLLDRDRVTQLLEERHQAMEALKGELVDTFADFSDSLQPEQRTRLAELIAKRMEHRWGHSHSAHSL